MAIQYILQRLSGDKRKVLDSLRQSNKEEALRTYQIFCEENPEEHCRVIKRQTIEETIVESDDYRQQKFSFAH